MQNYELKNGSFEVLFLGVVCSEAKTYGYVIKVRSISKIEVTSTSELSHLPVKRKERAEDKPYMKEKRYKRRTIKSSSYYSQPVLAIIQFLLPSLSRPLTI